MNEAAAEMRFEDAGRYKKRLDLLAGYQKQIGGRQQHAQQHGCLLADYRRRSGFCNFMRIVQEAVVNSFTMVELETGSRRRAARRALMR